MRVSILIIIYLYVKMPSFQFFEQVVLISSSKSSINAHLHHRLVLYTIISFNIFYSCCSKRIQKDVAVWNHETRNLRHSKVFSLSASRISLHQKRYMLQRFCSIWRHATLNSYSFGWRTTADLFYPGTELLPQTKTRIQLVSSTVKLNGCCPRTQFAFHICPP